MLLELAGVNFAGNDEVLDDVFGRGYPCFELVKGGVVERVADGANGFDTVKRFPNDARQECGGCGRWQT